MCAGIPSRTKCGLALSFAARTFWLEWSFPQCLPSGPGEMPAAKTAGKLILFVVQALACVGCLAIAHKRSSPILIPPFPIVLDRERPPDALRLLSPNTLKEILCTTPRPLLPLLNIAMLNRIVMHIVDRGPEMSIRTHLAVRTTTPNFAPATALFAVPLITRSAMQNAQCSFQWFESPGADDQVIVIGKEAPGVEGMQEWGNRLEQIRRERLHALTRMADDGSVLVAGAREDVLVQARRGPMRRRMPRTAHLAAKSEKLGALCRGQFAPVVHGK